MRDMSLLEFKKRLNKEFRSNKNLSKVVITGGNPALNRVFFQMCEYVKVKGLKLKITGTYTDKKIFKKYLRLVDEASVALDSLDRKTNDFLRGGGAFDLSQAAIKFFLKSNIKVQIHTVVNSTNIGEIKSYFDYLKKIDFFKENSWKLFRFAKFGKNSDYSITDQEWASVKNLERDKKVFMVDNVLWY